MEEWKRLWRRRSKTITSLRQQTERVHQGQNVRIKLKKKERCELFHNIPKYLSGTQKYDWRTHSKSWQRAEIFWIATISKAFWSWLYLTLITFWLCILKSTSFNWKFGSQQFYKTANLRVKISNFLSSFEEICRDLK